MDYEKKYKEALAIARWKIDTDCGDYFTVDDIKDIFSELKESEDERIRKMLIRIYKKADMGGEIFGEGITYKQVIAWLEKQGEQKPNGKVEPKFHKGDWVIDKQGIVHQIANVIENVTNHTYGYDIVGSGYFNDNTEGVRLWAIQDAKDGDVLYCDNSNTKTIYLFKEQRGSSNVATAYFQILNLNNELMLMFNKAADFNLNTCPATKEQRDLLFQKMKEAGYEWDAEKKELKKIEQKPTWSDEDEKIYNEIIDFFLGDYETRCVTIDKQRHFGYWLKSLKDRVQPQPKQEWSEKDEEIIKNIDSVLDHCINYFPKGSHTVYHDYKDWLKSIKPNHWKPSEEQLEALWNIIHNAANSDKDVIIIAELTSLYENLKQL